MIPALSTLKDNLHYPVREVVRTLPRVRVKRFPQAPKRRPRKSYYITNKYGNKILVVDESYADKINSWACSYGLKLSNKLGSVPENLEEILAEVIVSKARMEPYEWTDDKWRFLRWESAEYIAKSAAAFVLREWRPEFMQEVREVAAEFGSRSRRPRSIDPHRLEDADLAGLSIKKQALALGVTERTISNLRADLKRERELDAQLALTAEPKEESPFIIDWDTGEVLDVEEEFLKLERLLLDSDRLHAEFYAWGEEHLKDSLPAVSPNKSLWADFEVPGVMLK